MAASKRAWLYPETAERQYTRELVAYEKAYADETLKRLDTLRLDGISEDITVIIAGLLLFAESLAFPILARLPDRFMQVSTFNKQQWILQVKAGTGIDLRTPDVAKFRQTFGVGINLYQAEPWLVPLRDNWVAQNTSLIRNMPQQYLTQVEAIVRNGVAQGLSRTALAKQLEPINGIDKRRAKLIASDQINKANAALTQHRQMDLGIDEYVWRSSNDSRVRPTHAQANGQTFRWDKPPSFTDGHPGNAVRCRCTAAALFPD